MMKKEMIITMILLLAFVICTNAQSSEESGVAKSADESPIGLKKTLEQANKPEQMIRFNEETHDFGTIKRSDGKTNTVFTFVNCSYKPLVIDQVKTSCGCTVSKWTKTPVLPGETGYVKATYNPTHPTSFDRTLTVYSNGIPSPITLRIKGTVVN
jgi:hypothetical protein